MHIPTTLGLFALLLPYVSALRFAMYIDEWHTTDLPGKEHTAGITHAIMAFAKSTLFNADAPEKFKPFEPVDKMRARFGPDTKLMVAIGGWGDTEGFSIGAKDEASRAKYAKNVAKMVDEAGFDGVDIDWEYPGGNGDDYKKHPNSEKVDEIKTFPLFVQELRKALGKDKLLSLAVPGKRSDMMAFTKENGPEIWPSVDMVNVMSYDMMNRRDNVTRHHSSVAGSLDTVHAYAETGLEPAKMNLGVAYYAKWFTTAKGAGCAERPLGCEVVPLEKADGSDAGTSGVLTFEKGVLGAPPKELKETTDGTCGFAKKTKCPKGQCCSQYGSCGTTDEFCQGGCLSDYGECKGTSVIDSWRRAEKNGKTDTKAGGQYFFDKDVNLFWTWETVPLVERKFKEIVDAEKVGGVMAWSLGEDTLDFALVKAMGKGATART
ncbi:putative glycosyl hydrolase, family 18 [Aspergillus taichungensis]|uniref:chitinase n=1 Tax=Aspergillus taichungensis TaxID=482145 RepID=A0A2J5HYL2_9EURO|nr:putative glycosyl hydrolase, family 18 [Aspergillus taichungensis]